MKEGNTAKSPQGPSINKASPEQNDLLERIVVNAMRVIGSEEHGASVDGILSSGQSAGEGLANGITYVLQSVVGGLQKKGVDVTPEIIMSENGAASQVAQLLVALIGASGKDISRNEIQRAIEVGIQNFATKQRRDARGQQEMPANEQQGAPAAPPQEEVAQPGQRPGLLA